MACLGESSGERKWEIAVLPGPRDVLPNRESVKIVGTIIDIVIARRDVAGSFIFWSIWNIKDLYISPKTEHVDHIRHQNQKEPEGYRIMIELQWKPVNSSGKPILDKTGRLSSGSTLFFWFDAMSGSNFKWCQGLEGTKVPIRSPVRASRHGIPTASRRPRSGQNHRKTRE